MSENETGTPAPMAACSSMTRRDFMRASAIGALALGAAPLLQAQNAAHAAGSDRLRVGLIGCGGRGTGAAMDCVQSSPGVEIYALGDLFPDQIEYAKTQLTEKIGPALTATPERCFTGFDAIQKVLATEVDLVILATPPGFRPAHLAAAIDAGKHVFMEKPVAVDPVGVRKVIETSEKAKQKGLAIVAGTQRRHSPNYIATIQRIHDGAIGELVAGQAYWMMDGLWLRARKPEWTETEYQIRNWLYFDWLSGDHIVEQHMHNLDVINWAMGGPPEKAVGCGGRQWRTGPEYGNIYDHFAIEYEYANGARVASYCRQTDKAASRVAELLVGTKGNSNPAVGITGAQPFTYESAEPFNPLVIEHADLIKSIRDGQPLNEGARVAESTMTAIMGRMAAYTGRELSWKWLMNASKLDLTPEKVEFGPMPMRPVPIPGVAELV